jgi:hypothetical protein
MRAVETLLAPPVIRSPGQEVYGRSSGSAHRLGRVALISEGLERLRAIINSPEAIQTEAEFITSVEEGLTTDTELGMGLEDRSFETAEVAGGKVMAKDGKRAVSDMTEAGLECARARASTDKHFWRQLIRSEWDNDIALTGDAMVRGETEFNTYIMVSPYPQEGETESGPEYWQQIGFVPHLKRGFVWLFYVSKDGFVRGSLSFSGSDKQRIRTVLGQHGRDIPEDEVTDNYPGYAITGNLTLDEAKALATVLANEAGDPKFRKPNELARNKIINTVDLTRRYRPIMRRVFRESYVPVCDSLGKGYQTEQTRELIYQLANNAHEFEPEYARALYRMRANSEQFTWDDWAVLHDVLVYSTIEMVRALHLQESALLLGPDPEGFSAVSPLPLLLQSANTQSLQSMLGGFGANGARNGRTYSACGVAISLGGKGKNGGNDSGGSRSERSSSDDQAEGGACEYVHTGCYCCPYNDDGSSRDSPMKVLARREANGTAYCRRSGCGAWLSADGKSKNIGNIARRAQNRTRGRYALAA